MTADYRAELQRLLGAVENDVIDTNDGPRFQAAVDRAHAALAQPEPQGVGLTDEELNMLAWKIYTGARDGDHRGAIALRVCRAAIAADRARWGRPAIEPVPVSERLPGPEDCDSRGWCWYWHPGEECWEMVPVVTGTLDIWTHWLPHHALPIPAPKGCETGTHPV
jgi:hypothetical protein